MIKEADAKAIDAHIADLAASIDDTESMLGEALRELSEINAESARYVHEIVFNFHADDPRYDCAQIVLACLTAFRPYLRS